MIYGTATYYSHLRFEPAEATDQAAAMAALRPAETTLPGGARDRARRHDPAGGRVTMATLLKTPTSWPKILTERSGMTDPVDLDGAIGLGAFSGLRTAVRDLGPTALIAAIAASGLRGRGGAGFPTGEKWRTAATTEAPRRYVVANGYGADPASGTDRYLLEHDPYARHRGARDRRLRDRRGRGDHRGPCRGHRGDPPARDRDRRGHRRRVHRRGRLRARGATCRSRSGPSRARTCSARRPCC